MAFCPVTAALHHPPLPPFRSHHQLGDYSCHRHPVLHLNPPPITRLWHPSCHPQGVGLVGVVRQWWGIFAPFTVSLPHLWICAFGGVRTSLGKNYGTAIFLKKTLIVCDFETFHNMTPFCDGFHRGWCRCFIKVCQISVKHSDRYFQLSLGVNVDFMISWRTLKQTVQTV